MRRAPGNSGACERAHEHTSPHAQVHREGGMGKGTRGAGKLRNDCSSCLLAQVLARTCARPHTPTSSTTFSTSSTVMGSKYRRVEVS